MRALRPLRVLIVEGSHDDVRLLLHKLCHATLAPASTPCPGEISGHQSIKILLVEDNRDTLLYLAWELGQHRYTVRTAANLTAARKLAASEEFQLLISDIELPDGTGLDLMREIQRTRGVPGIAISGLSSGDDIRLSQAAGFVAHLTKPICFQTLEATIRRVVSAVVPSPSPR